MSKFLDLFQGKKETYPPIWFMRQAGRYLPEYGVIRKSQNTFLELCYNPALATQITLQPIERFDLDVAILFSDILVIPNGLGQVVSFEEGQGPKLSPLSLHSFQKELSFDRYLEKLSPVYEALRLIRSQLASDKALLGFAGAPWTLALYVLEGGGSRDFAKAKREAFHHEKEFLSLLDFLTHAISLHLIEQVKAGAQAIQLFDTWGGLCPASYVRKWIFEPTQKIITSLREVFPHLPIIGFPKGMGVGLKDYASLGFSAVSLDSSVPLPWALQNLPSDLIFQGNLDPLLLVVGGDPLKRAVELIHQQMDIRPYIFNLGHGILPQTPPQNVADCVSWVRALR